MTEKLGVNDVLSTLNSMINMINYSIQQCNNNSGLGCKIKFLLVYMLNITLFHRLTCQYDFKIS